MYDVETAAIKTLKDDQASLMARRVGAFVAKEVASRELYRKNEALGTLAWIFMHASERADLRQWSTLPQTLQVIRKVVDPGEYAVSLIGINNFGFPTSDRMPTRTIKLQAGQQKFIVWRSLN